MKKSIITYLIISLGLALTSFGQLIVESENATLSGGPSVTNYKSTACVYMQSAGSITHNFNITKKGFYKLELRVAAPQYKEQFLYINNTIFSKLKMNENAGFYTIDMGAVSLNPGSNTIEIRAEWGYAYFDKVTLSAVAPVDYSKVKATTINPNTNAKTKEVYDYLRSQYGKNIVSGQTAFWDSLKIVARKQTKIRAFDFQHYTQGYAYLWKNGGHTLGWEDDGTTQAAINWYNTTKGQGIVTFQWHWHAPMNSQPSKNTFMTNQTTFDVSKAIVPGNQEYTEIIEDIDSIATQLKKLQKAGVPVLWRPLHEAAGNGAVDGSQAWFWWGAKGAGVCEQLWDIMYDRLTNYHQLNNLLWVWSTPEEHWYLGNGKLDVFGFDSYPTPIHNNSQKAIFSQMHAISGGEKLIAMTENGPIPAPDKCIEDDAMWSYFCSWDNLLTKQNSRTHVTSVFEHTNIVVLENTNYWEFSTSKEGWNTAYNITTQANNGFLEGSITANDPQIFSANDLMLSAQNNNWLLVSMQNNTTASSAEFFWTTLSSPNFDGTKRVSFPIVPNDTQLRYYIIDLSDNPAWTGEIKQMRLDPTIAATGSVKIDFIKLTTPHKTLATIPGTIEAENFNTGGMGNAYFDTDLANNGGEYRTKELVDIQTCSEGGYNVGWTAEGEWMEYLVDITKSGSYELVLRASAPLSGTSVDILVDGQTLVQQLEVLATGAYQEYDNTSKVITLPAGKHVLKIKANTGRFNLNKISFTDASITSVYTLGSANTVSIYPNPSNDKLTVLLNKAPTTKIELRNLLGELIYSTTISDTEHTFTVSEYIAGVYLLNVNGETYKVFIGN